MKISGEVQPASLGRQQNLGGFGTECAPRAMGLLQGARQNPGAPEDEEWGDRSAPTALWFGRFAVLPLRSCAPRAALRELRPCEWRFWERAAPSHVIIDLESIRDCLGAAGRSHSAAGGEWEDLSVRVGLRRP